MRIRISLRWLPILVVLLVALPASAQVAYVQSATNMGFATGTSSSLTYSSSNQTGDLLLCYLEIPAGATISSVADSNGNTWAPVFNSSSNNYGAPVALFYAYNAKAGANTVMAHFSAATTGGMYILEYSGILSTANPLDVFATSSVSPGTSVSPSITTTMAGDLIFTAFTQGNNRTITPPSGYALRVSQTYDFTADLIASNPKGTYTLTWSSPGPSLFGSVAAFKPASAPSQGVAILQSATDLGFATGTSASLAYSSANQATDLLLCYVEIPPGATISSVSDSNGNTWNAVFNSTSNNAGQPVALFYAYNANAGANTVTAHFSAASTGGMYILEYSGILSAANPLDVFSINSVALGTSLSTSITTSVQGDLIFTAFTQGNKRTVTPPSGYALRVSQSYDFVADLIGTNSIGTYTPLWSTGHTSLFVSAVAFKPASGGAPAPQLSLTSNGSPVTPSGLNFGNVTTNTSAVIPLTINNVGTATLSVNSTALTGSSTFSDNAASMYSIPAGQSATFNVTFTPTSIAAFNGTLTITSNDAHSPATVPLAGNGVASTQAVSYRQSATNMGFPSGASASLAYSAANQVGDLLLCYLEIPPGATISSVSDSNGNTWVPVFNSSSNNAGQPVALFYAYNVNAGANTVTAHFSAATTGGMYILEYSGILSTANPLDVFATSSVSPGTSVSPSITTTVAGDLIFTALTQGNVRTITPPSGYTLRVSQTYDFTADMIGTNPVETYTPTWSSPGPSLFGSVAAFESASGGGTGGQPTVSISPARAGLTLNQTLSVTATTNDTKGVTWTATGGTFSSGSSLTGVPVTYTAPSSAGSYTITATSVSNGSVKSSIPVYVTNLSGVYTYHNDLARDGVNAQEYGLTTSTVNSSTFGKLFSCTADGAIYAQPLWVANLTVNGAKHNVVFVATQHDSLYAFDADANPCVQLWKVSLIDSNHGGSSNETSVPSGVPGFLVGDGSGDITPEVGVTGTPVIDPTTNTLYVVSKSVNPSGPTFYQRLQAIDITTGNEKFGGPATIGITSSSGVNTSSVTFPGTGDGGSTVTFNARQENQRPGLALVNGVVYVAWASHEDNPPWYGWVVGFNASTLAVTNVLNVTPNVGDGGIWMGGGAPAVDNNNNLYVITGNGGFDATNASAPNNDYGDSFLQLSPSLGVTSYFTPSDQLSDQQNDQDFGAGGAAVVLNLTSGTLKHLVIGGGKDEVLYLLNGDSMGGSGDSNARQHFSIGSSIYATGAFWNNNFYLAGRVGPVLAYAFNTSTDLFNPTATSSSPGPTTYGDHGATPSVSSLGSSNGIVWTQDNTNYCTNQSPGCGPTVLHAYNATNLGNELWNSSQISGDAAGNAVKFTLPTVANSKVYVGDRGNNTGGVFGSTSISGQLDVYGLKPY